MNISRIDCHPLGGVAGDMFAAALFDAFPGLYPKFENDLAQLGIEGLCSKLTKQTSNGLYAQHFSVEQKTEFTPPRTLPAVAEFLNQTPLDQGIITAAVEIYRLLAEAEAAVHGKSVDTIHFHEVSDWDSMVDIVAAAGAISRLQCPCWRIGPLPLGGGTITTAHGDIPLPAPATVQLLKGFDWMDDGQPGERVTPTGGAILAYLAPVKLLGPTPPASLSTIGNGCGSRQLKDRANIFRICGFSESTGAIYETDLIATLAFEVDDMTGEEIAQALDVLRAEHGVLDASTVTMQGKKGRLCTGIRVLAKPEAINQVTDQCFRQTTTLGVRSLEVQRKILCRRSETIDGRRVKIAERPDDVRTAKIESSELVGLDSLNNRRKQALQTEQNAIDE